MDIQSLIRPSIKDLEPYRPPDWEAIAARAGLSPDQLVRLDANENPFGPSPRVFRALARFENYGFYPDYCQLAAIVARYAAVAPENVVLGNGGDEIIDLAVRLFVNPGQDVILCSPAFDMYTVNTRAHRGRVLDVPRRDDFSLDLEGIESLVAGQGSGLCPRLLFVTSPGNPDGQAIPPEVIRRLLRLPLAVFVDEAYIEFGGESVVPLIDECPNLIVLRTFSKWAGLAGLRLGYALTSTGIAEDMARLRPPYNVNAAAVVAALATFEDMDRVQATIDRIISERERLHAALAEMPEVCPLPSQANFVFFRLDGRSGREAAGLLARRGILVRSFSDPALADALRVTVGRPEQNDAFLSALYDVLCGEQDTNKETSFSAPGPKASLRGSVPGDGAWSAEQGAEGSRPVSRRAMGRRGQVRRQTRETDVAVDLKLDGTGSYEIDTGLGFLDHMLAQIAVHGLFDVRVRARGDLQVDEHHTVEDVAIGLGQALDAALGDRAGIVRMGQAYAPLDESLARVVVDLSGRPYAVVEAEFSTPRVGAMDTDLVIHFLETLAVHARLSLHAGVLCGRNDHHKAEALFKALGRALDAATRLDPRRPGVPSTKEVL